MWVGVNRAELESVFSDIQIAWMEDVFAYSRYDEEVDGIADGSMK